MQNTNLNSEKVDRGWRLCFNFRQISYFGPSTVRSYEQHHYLLYMPFTVNALPIWLSDSDKIKITIFLFCPYSSPNFLALICTYFDFLCCFGVSFIKTHFRRYVSKCIKNCGYLNNWFSSCVHLLEALRVIWWSENENKQNRGVRIWVVYGHPIMQIGWAKQLIVDGLISANFSWYPVLMPRLSVDLHLWPHSRNKW